MRVLVVDDNIIDRRLVKYTLQSHLNIVAETAKDGLEALNRIKCESFDLVITDIVMPKIEGIELINHIQSISPNTKIIAISGNNPYYLYIVKSWESTPCLLNHSTSTASSNELNPYLPRPRKMWLFSRY